MGCCISRSKVTPTDRETKTGCCVGGTLFGPIRIPDPPDEGVLTTHVVSKGIKWIKSTEDKIVEYCVMGSMRADAKVFVTVYCAMEERCYSEEVQQAWEMLNIREINVSIPAVGYSEAQPGQPIAEWPKTCLAPILEAEGVDKFGVHGNSAGTQFAMAIANDYSPARCMVLGLRAAFVNLPLSKQLKFKPGQGVFHSVSDIQRGTLKGHAMKKMYGSMPEMFKDYDKDAEAFEKTCNMIAPEMYKDHKDTAQMVVHMNAKLFTAHYGALAMPLYAAKDQLLDNPIANVDPRELAEKLPGDRISVWYCEQDTDVPPAHTKWLAEECLKAKKIRIVNGYDHDGACALFMSDWYKEMLDLWPED
jgi:hypothetical protein